MTIAPGTYLVRYKATSTQNASSPTSVTVSAGNQITVTFKADGVTVATRKINYNGTITDIPEIPAKGV